MVESRKTSEDIGKQRKTMAELMFQRKVIIQILSFKCALNLGKASSMIIVCTDYCNSRKMSENSLLFF